MFGWRTIRENDVRLNNDLEKYRSALWSFANSTIRPCDDSVKWLSAIFFSGKTTIRQSCISGKWCSAEGRFGKMTFGWTTIRKNIVRYYEVSLIRRFGHVTIRSNDFRQFFFRAKQRFGKVALRQNDDSMKWRFEKVMWPPLARSTASTHLRFVPLHNFHKHHKALFSFCSRNDGGW